MSSTATKTEHATTKSTSKSSSKGHTEKIVTLKLSPKLLSRFAPAVAIESAASSRKESIASSSTPSAPTPKDVKEDITPQPNGTESNAASTPAASGNNMLAPPTNARGRKGVPGPKPGLKRTASQLDTNGAPKPRGKPGPKKKQRIGENGEVLQQADKPAAPKLGPKASGGAINANLRALDRTGKPCRRWEKRPFAVKSFTGYFWGAGTYASSRKSSQDFSGDVRSDSSSSGDKPTQDGSGLPSEKSNSGDAATPNVPVGLTSSPAPRIAVNASA